jgi:hypothetical protein
MRLPANPKPNAIIKPLRITDVFSRDTPTSFRENIKHSKIVSVIALPKTAPINNPVRIFFRIIILPPAFCILAQYYVYDKLFIGNPDNPSVFWGGEMDVYASKERRQLSL